MKPSEDVKKMFEQDRFATDNGAYIEEVDDHYAKCSLMIEDRHKNAMGAVMGGVYFTLADFALAVAFELAGNGFCFSGFSDYLPEPGERGEADSRGGLCKEGQNDQLL